MASRALGAKTPKVVSQAEWNGAHAEMLKKEKEFTRQRDALAAERRRMPWVAVEKTYMFEGPKGKASLLDLFEGRRQLILYRAFFEPGVFGWPDHACRGCSMGADQVSTFVTPERSRHYPCLGFARGTERYWTAEGADGLGDAVVHHDGQL